MITQPADAGPLDCLQEGQEAKPQQPRGALSSAYAESRRAKDGFAGIPHGVTADPNLSDEGFRLLAALESWAWNKPQCCPTNQDIAIRTGWITKSGSPAISKVKRVLLDLEGKSGGRAYIQRVLVSNEGANFRSRIELLRPFGIACQSGTPNGDLDEEEKSTQRRRKRQPIPVTPERLAELKAMPYREYLQSPEWSIARERALRAARNRCQVCNGNDRGLDVHHRNYKRRGEERKSDLTVLCHGCHRLFHENRKLASG